MLRHLNDFIQEPECIYTCRKLAEEYQSLGQTASAFMLYMRAANKSSSKEVQYECLIECAKILWDQKNRHDSVRTLLLHARRVNWTRPESYYYLSMLYESRNDYLGAYDEALKGLRFCSDKRMEAKLVFQIAVSSWWAGEEDVSRQKFLELKNKYSEHLDPDLFRLCQDNLIRLGVSPRSHNFAVWGRGDPGFSFDGIEAVQKNYSQCKQDMFVLTALNGKRNGTYLEIGAGHPTYGNNTYLLESQFDWTGLSIEINEDLVREYNSVRKNEAVLSDATKVDYERFCSEIAQDGYIDYLQIDVEPSTTSLEVLQKIPFDKFRFGCITFEHDDYIDMSNSCKAKSRQILLDAGYKLWKADISVDGSNSFEDWWVLNS